MSGSRDKKSENDSPEYDCLVGVVIVGDERVGKSQLMARYVDNDNVFSPVYDATLVFDVKSKVNEIKNKNVKFMIWDIAGSERFRTITENYYRMGQAILVVFDITKRESFDHIENYISKIKNHANKNVQIILVGNKADLTEERKVSVDEGQRLAKELRCQYKETSAKENVGINEVFELIAKQQLKLANVISTQHATNTSPTQSRSNFIQRHWRAMLVGALIVGGIVAIGVFTGGIGLAVAGGAVAGAVVVGAIGGGLIDKIREDRRALLQGGIAQQQSSNTPLSSTATLITQQQQQQQQQQPEQQRSTTEAPTTTPAPASTPKTPALRTTSTSQSTTPKPGNRGGS